MHVTLRLVDVAITADVDVDVVTGDEADCQVGAPPGDAAFLCSLLIYIIIAHKL